MNELQELFLKSQLLSATIPSQKDWRSNNSRLEAFQDCVYFMEKVKPLGEFGFKFSICPDDMRTFGVAAYKATEGVYGPSLYKVCVFSPAPRGNNDLWVAIGREYREGKEWAHGEKITKYWYEGYENFDDVAEYLARGKQLPIP